MNSAAFLLMIFLASAGRVAVTEGGDLGDLGVIPQQAFWPVQSGQNRKTCICLHCLPVCEKTYFYETLVSYWLTFPQEVKICSIVFLIPVFYTIIRR